MMIEAAAESSVQGDRLRGRRAATRSATSSPTQRPRRRDRRQRPVTLATALFTDDLPPPSLRATCRRSSGAVFFVYGEQGQPDGDDAEQGRSTRPRSEQKEIWEVPNGQHIGGVKAEPAEYERRVVGFFDRNLVASRSRP